MATRTKHIGEPYLSTRDLMELLPLGRATICRMAARGEIPAVRLGHKKGKLAFRPADVRAYLDSQRICPDNDDDPAESTGPSVTTSAGDGGGDAER